MLPQAYTTHSKTVEHSPSENDGGENSVKTAFFSSGYPFGVIHIQPDWDHEPTFAGPFVAAGSQQGESFSIQYGVKTAIEGGEKIHWKNRRAFSSTKRLNSVLINNLPFNGIAIPYRGKHIEVILRRSDGLQKTTKTDVVIYEGAELRSFSIPGQNRNSAGSEILSFEVPTFSRNFVVAPSGAAFRYQQVNAGGVNLVDNTALPLTIITTSSPFGTPIKLFPAAVRVDIQVPAAGINRGISVDFNCEE